MNILAKSFKVAWELEKKAFIYGVLWAVLSAVTPYIPIFLSSIIIDYLAAGEKFEKLLITAGIGLVIIFIFRLIEDYIFKLRRYHTEIAYHNYDMDNYIKLLDMDYELLDSPKTNAVRQRIQEDNSWSFGIANLYWFMPKLFGNIAKFITAIVVLIPLFTRKAFWGGIGTPVYLVVMFATIVGAVCLQIKYIIPQQDKVRVDSNKGDQKYLMYFLWGRQEYKEGKDIRIYNAGVLLDDYMELGWKARLSLSKIFSRADGLGGGVEGLKQSILQGGAYLLVVLRAVAGALTVGEVVKYSAAIANFVNSFTDIFLSINECIISGRRLQSTIDYLNIENEMYKGTIPVEKRKDNEYELEFRNVSFKYPGSDRYVLKNLSMKLNIGRRMAVVGMNGSGKTTMIKLLCRLYDPTEGEITLNGVNIKKYKYDEYMDIFSVVFQDFKLFSYSLAQNVAASVMVDEQKAKNCLEMTGLGDRLKAMPRGIETPIYKDFEEDGVEISGGEAQKIALSRALYKSAPFIILDEPTAALDPIAEFEVYSKFNEIVGGKTAVYISHRLSSCRFCDDIAVFHEGELIQRGSHDKLLSDENGKYYDLWNAQAQYYTNS